jgi:hypothetical protein
MLNTPLRAMAQEAITLAVFPLFYHKTPVPMTTEQSDFTSDSAFERIRLTGENIISELRSIIEKGNAQRLLVKNADGKVLFSTSLTLGAGGAAGFMLFHPILATVASLIMMYNNLQVIVEREVDNGDENEIEIDDDDSDAEK